MHCPSKTAFAPLPPRVRDMGQATFDENFKIPGGIQIYHNLQMLAGSTFAPRRAVLPVTPETVVSQSVTVTSYVVHGRGFVT